MVPDGDGITFLRDHDVIVEGDQIADVRPRKSTEDQTVDATGQILLPGFISGHSLLPLKHWPVVGSNRTAGSIHRPRRAVSFVRWRLSTLFRMDRGLLDQPLFGAHCSGLENLEEDLKVMAHPNFTFVHCPSAAGAGQSPSQQVYPETLAAGVNTSIGFDTHSNDYIENIKQATIQGRARMLLLHEASSVPMKDPTVWDGLNSATLAGARGLGRPDLGRIEAGAKADLSTVDVSGLLVGNGIAPRDPWNNLLYANGLSVRNVVIDGVWKVREGALMFEDENTLRSRGGAAATKIWDQMERDGFFVEMPK